MLGCGVPERYFDAKAQPGVSKRVYVRETIEELAKRDAGHIVLDRIALEMSKLDGPLHPEKLDVEIARTSISKLRFLVAQAGIRDVPPARPDSSQKPKIASVEREALLLQVRERFRELINWTETPQSRGYAFQDLLKELFRAYDLEYHPSFRDTAQEIDGMFVYDGRRFHVEARWRKEEASFDALSTFRSKLVTKFAGTVGIFISMAGFEPGAVDELGRLGESRFLLLPGVEFMKIVEQTISLPDALKQMVNEAHKKGVEVVALNL
jgi:hypothetical protein